MNSFCKLWRLSFSVLLPFVTQHFYKIHGDVFMDTVVKDWKGLLEVSCTASCLHIRMSPMGPVMFWVSSGRNYMASWDSQSLPTLVVIFFFIILRWNFLYSSLCLLCCILLLSTSEGVWLCLLYIFPKVVANSTKISPFLKSGVTSLITSVS